ncbi:MAG: 3-coathanger stack domain-containing protein [Flavobacteriales bacterium]
MQLSKYIIVLFVLFVGSALGQTHQNLVYNPGFEMDGNGNLVDINNCSVIIITANGTSMNGYCPTVGNSGATYTDMLNYWAEIYAWSNPDRKSQCNWNNYRGNGSADVLCDGMNRSGRRAESGTGTEYAVSPLRQSLSTNKKYYIEFYYRGELNGDKAGLRFFESKPKQCWGVGSQNLDDDGPPHVEMTSPNTWKKYQGFYQPDKNYSWLAIGRFDKPKNTSRLYFDDIRIFEVDNNLCVGNWLFQNTDLYSWIFQAGNKIEAGSNIASYSSTHYGDVVVKNNNSVIFRAGNQVVLEPGFYTELGAYFEAVIEPCQNNPCPSPPSFASSYQSCSDNPITIGTPNHETGLFYSWSPITYLDNPNAANPVFTSPPGVGSITYTVTVTSACGYFTNPNPPTPLFVPFVPYYYEHRKCIL